MNHEQESSIEQRCARRSGCLRHMRQIAQVMPELPSYELDAAIVTVEVQESGPAFVAITSKLPPVAGSTLMTLADLDEMDRLALWWIGLRKLWAGRDDLRTADAIIERLASIESVLPPVVTNGDVIRRELQERIRLAGEALLNLRGGWSAKIDGGGGPGEHGKDE